MRFGAQHRDTFDNVMLSHVTLERAHMTYQKFSCVSVLVSCLYEITIELTCENFYHKEVKYHSNHKLHVSSLSCLLLGALLTHAPHALVGADAPGPPPDSGPCMSSSDAGAGRCSLPRTLCMCCSSVAGADDLNAVSFSLPLRLSSFWIFCSVLMVSLTGFAAIPSSPNFCFFASPSFGFFGARAATRLDWCWSLDSHS